MNIHNSIKHKLFCILIVMGAIPFLIVIIAGANSMISELESNMQKSGMLRNAMISEHVSELLEKNFYVLHSLALNPTIIQYVTKPSENYDFVAKILKPE